MSTGLIPPQAGRAQRLVNGVPGSTEPNEMQRRLPERLSHEQPPARPEHGEPVAVFDNYWGTTLSFVASLGRRGVPLVLYGRGAGRWSRYATRRAACPAVEDAQRFLPWLEQRVRSGQIVRVAPTTDLIAYYVSLLREAFAPEVRRTIAPLSELEGSLIKTRLALACEQAGQAVPAIRTPEDPQSAMRMADEIGYPLILKPKSHLVVGTLERGKIVRNPEQLRESFRPYPIVAGQELLAERHPELRWPLLQEYIASARTRVFSVSGLKDPDGGIVAASLSCKCAQWPPDTGVSTCQVSWHDERVLQAGLATVDRLVSRGFFELELLSRGTELLAIDLNPRAFGFLALDMAVGNDLPWLWFQSTLAPVAAGPRAGAPRIIKARVGVPYWIERAVRRLFGAGTARDDLPGETTQKVARTISMVGHADDPVPFILWELSLLRHPRALVRPYVREALRSRGRRAPDRIA